MSPLESLSVALGWLHRARTKDILTQQEYTDGCEAVQLLTRMMLRGLHGSGTTQQR